MKVQIFVTLLSAVNAAPLNAFAGDPIENRNSDFAENFPYSKFANVNTPAISVKPKQEPPVSVMTAIDSSLQGAMNRLSDGATTTYHFITPIYETVRQGTADLINTTSVAAENAVTQATGMVQGVASNVGKVAYQTKTFVIQATQKAEGFFSSTFGSIKGWFTNLEDEVKEFLHFALRVAEVTAVIAILVVFFWILKRVTSGYRFLKSIGDSFELHDRTGTPS